MTGSDERFEEWWKKLVLGQRLWKDVLKEAWEAGQRDAQDYP